jgi:hypothetical protein
MAYDSATQHALALPEVLDEVLIHLPVGELLLSQRICRQFASIIRTVP